MRKQRILLCDTDEAYVQALSAFLITTMKDLKLTCFSSVEGMINDTENYDISLISDEFAEAASGYLNSNGGMRLGKIYLLCGTMGYSSDIYDVVYKFQPMREFVDSLCRVRNENIRANTSVKCMWTGICSPIHHELQLPFALAYVAQLKNTEPASRILFMDLEDNSILPELCGFVPDRNITDYLYLLESEGIERGELLDCMCNVNGVSCLSPARYFQELTEVDPDKWRNLFLSIQELGFERVVILFDTSMRGMEVLLSCLDNLLLLGREGDYYRKYDRQIMNFISDRFSGLDTLATMLPLSGLNLTDGTYQLEHILAGNLSAYAREAMEAVAGAG